MGYQRRVHGTRLSLSTRLDRNQLSPLQASQNISMSSFSPVIFLALLATAFAAASVPESREIADELSALKQSNADLLEMFKEVQREFSELKAATGFAASAYKKKANKPRDCNDVKQLNPYASNGVFTITPKGKTGRSSTSDSTAPRTSSRLSSNTDKDSVMSRVNTSSVCNRSTSSLRWASGSSASTWRTSKETPPRPSTTSLKSASAWTTPSTCQASNKRLVLLATLSSNTTVKPSAAPSSTRTATTTRTAPRCSRAAGGTTTATAPTLTPSPTSPRAAPRVSR